MVYTFYHPLLWRTIKHTYVRTYINSTQLSITHVYAFNVQTNPHADTWQEWRQQQESQHELKSRSLIRIIMALLTSQELLSVCIFPTVNSMLETINATISKILYTGSKLVVHLLATPTLTLTYNMNLLQHEH